MDRRGHRPGRSAWAAWAARAAAMAVVGLLALLGGCAPSEPEPSRSSSLAAPASPANPDVTLAAQAAEARLDPCPAGSVDLPAQADGLPDVTLDCLGSPGTPPVRLSGLRGPALVNVWGSWCSPCREEAPLLQRLHAAAGKRLTVLGIDYEDADVPALAFAADRGLHYPSVTDPDGTFPLRRYAAGPPVTLFVDADGRTAHIQRGPFQSWDELRGLVRTHLGLAL